MARKNGIITFVILIIFALTIWSLLQPIHIGNFVRDEMRLGLDLVGGVHLVYEVKFADNATAADKSGAIERALITIQKRIDTYGVTEPIVQKMGEDRILVQLPGFTDIDAAKKLVQQTGFLDFREVERDAAGELVYLSTYLSGNLTDFVDKSETGNRLFVGDENEKGSSRPIAFLVKDEKGFRFTDPNGNAINKADITKYGSSHSWVPSRGDDGTPLTGGLLSDSQATFSQEITGAKPVVSIKWNSEGSKIFDQIALRLHDPLGEQGTVHNYKYVLGIFLDNYLISDPKINSSNFGGSAIIAGSFTTAEVEELANLLKSGSLPVELKKPPLYQEKVSATLGAEFIDMSWKAALIGLGLVMLFMIAYYRVPGAMASLALIFYGTLTLAICKLWPITLSLGSIGGIIVSMGIAVDANVLIFERMKEEFRMGRTLGAAIEAGFHRAWTAIWDSNMTTFIACIILYWLGSSAMHNAAVIGFAVTLFIGAIVSMFTAVFVTRTLLRLFTGTSLAAKTGLFTVSGGKK